MLLLGKYSEILPILHVCLLSLPLLIGTLLLDFYHYTVWWCYTPQIDSQCHCRSRKHERYIPYHLVGEDRRTHFLGDTPCTSDPCYNRHLSHVVIFHSRDYKPQPRWSTLDTRNNTGTYIGFHTTTPKVAVLIAHSEFKISDRAGMLGKGIYFARSMQDTIGKANSTGGACIIAEIRMGKVYQFEKQSVIRHVNNPYYDPRLHEFVRSSQWHDEYDTCYLNHDNESKDEFCIKDPVNQIIRWIVVIHDPYDAKVKQYGLDTEFNSTLCSCI